MNDLALNRYWACDLGPKTIQTKAETEHKFCMVWVYGWVYIHTHGPRYVYSCEYVYVHIYICYPPLRYLGFRVCAHVLLKRAYVQAANMN